MGLTSASANRENGLRPRLVDRIPLHTALRAAMDTESVPVVAQLSFEAQEQLVLSVLVERFGGEVTGDALTRYLTQQSVRTQPPLGPGLIDVLQTLHRLGALSLEANGKNDFIVRLLPDGTKSWV